MKIRIMFVLITSIISNSSAQDKDDTWFDFWIGKWNVQWTEADGGIGKGTNTVIMILDSAVIQENFEVKEGIMKGYLGTSLSVYNPKNKSWHQGYADNRGAYFNFIGERLGQKRIFKTETVTRGDKKIVQRMVFYDITEKSFMWDCQSSEDGGKTWKLNWQITYHRAQGN